MCIRDSEDTDIVTATGQHLGQVTDVVLHTPRHVKGVRTDEPDPHRGLAAMSALKTGCSMCQSWGTRRIAAVKKSAISCVIARTPSLPGSTSMTVLKSRRNRGPRYSDVKATSGAPDIRASAAGPVGIRAACLLYTSD